MEAGKTEKVMQGALLLTIAGLFSKVLSATYRIPLQNLTGDLGFYIYQQIYPLIGMVIILGLYGFPVAVSKLIAERIKAGKSNSFRQVYGPLFLVVFAISGAISLLLYVTAPQITMWIGDPKLLDTFRMASGLFLLLPFIATLRGVFQGHEQMVPTAYSQMLEQLIRVTIIITAAYFVYNGYINVYSIGKAGVVASLLAMGIVILIWLIFLMVKQRSLPKTKEKVPWIYYLRICFSLGIIAALSHMILILMQLVDVFTIVPGLMTAGSSAQQAMESKGIFDRGQPLIQFGVVFGSSFALALVPTVVHDSEERILAIREALLFSFYLSGAAAIGLILMMPEVNELLFMNKAGTASLQILAIAVALSALIITACSILQSMGYVWLIAGWILIAFGLKWLLNSLLVPIFHIQGSAVATTVSLLVLLLAVIRLLQQKFPELKFIRHIRWGTFFMANAMMVAFLLLVKYIFLIHMDFTRIGLLVYVFVVIGIGAAIYIIFLLRYQVLSDKQLQAMPFSGNIITLSKLLMKRKEDEK